MTPEPKPTRHRVLLVDDDPALLDVYRELLSQLPSAPEILTANSGPRAMAMLEAERFRLLVCDLKMPKMDGLQVLSIVRRKYPELRTVALTSVPDEQFRSRVYALGVDLFWHKPATERETQMLLECVESLLGQDGENGFRGLQSKSLVDIVQLECLSQSSSVLRITNGSLSGKIWIQDGEVVDAEAGELRAEPAFQKILSWRAGGFETLPAEPTRPRTIFKAYSGLLLESAQALDESRSEPKSDSESFDTSERMEQLSDVQGLEFVLALKAGNPGYQVARGIENPERMAKWAQENLEQFRALGEQLRAGPLETVEALGPYRHVTLACQGETDLCMGWEQTGTLNEIRDRMKRVLNIWAC